MYEQLDYSTLPSALRERGRILASEYMWEPEDVIEVINHFEALGKCVVGVELFQEVDGRPKFLATSGFDRTLEKDPNSGPKDYAACAREFVEQFRTEEGALFNLT